MRTMPTAITMVKSTVKTPPALLASSETMERLKIIQEIRSKRSGAGKRRTSEDTSGSNPEMLSDMITPYRGNNSGIDFRRKDVRPNRNPFCPSESLKLHFSTRVLKLVDNFGEIPE